MNKIYNNIITKFPELKTVGYLEATDILDDKLQTLQKTRKKIIDELKQLIVDRNIKANANMIALEQGKQIPDYENDFENLGIMLKKKSELEKKISKLTNEIEAIVQLYK